MKRFNISLRVDAQLAVDEIWPDGDAPESPTATDVLAVIDGQGGLDILRDWNLADDQDFEVREAPAWDGTVLTIKRFAEAMKEKA